ncbi:MAG: hypothetical protein Rhims3KO_19870 [Hyphomicrobiales bacterium]
MAKRAVSIGVVRLHAILLPASVMIYLGLLLPTLPALVEDRVIEGPNCTFLVPRPLAPAQSLANVHTP